jgi:hypothetical protein
MVCPEREEGACEVVHECIDDRLGICIRCPEWTCHCLSGKHILSVKCQHPLQRLSFIITCYTILIDKSSIHKHLYAITQVKGSKLY